MKIWHLLLVLLPVVSGAQDLQPGGLQGDQPLLLTPSPEVNRALQGKTVWEAEPFGMRPLSNTFEWLPNLQPGWTWMAAFNFEYNGQKQNIFYYDSWIGTTQRNARTGGRKRNFEQDVTKLIASNAYHMAFQREAVVENEIFMFVYSPDKKKVIIALDERTIGVKRRLEYDFEANEAKFIHIIIPPKEYTNAIWFPEVSKREIIDISKGWRFVLEDADIKNMQDFPLVNKNPFTAAKSEAVDLPHTWNARDIFDQRPIKDAINVMPMYHRGVGWYQKKLRIPIAMKDKYLKINFLGANQTAEVWFNGQHLGMNNNGYLDFHFDITPYAKFDQENEIIVKVNNEFDYDIPPHSADYNQQGGIYREVELIALHPVFVKRTLVSTPEVNFKQANYTVKTTLRSKDQAAQTLRLVTNLINPYNEIAESFTLQVNIPAGGSTDITHSGTVSTPLLWSPAYPHSYRVQNILYTADGATCLDEQTEQFGFRSIELSADKGLKINGQATKLKGVNVHQDVWGKGWAMNKDDKRRDFIMIKEMGTNFVRLAHYPHHPYVMHLCDSLGLMVWSEIPVVNTVGRNQFIANAVDQMERLILRDYNHPSVIMWGVGNEYYRSFSTETDAEYALELTRQTAAKAKALDPYRPTVQAQNDLVDNRILPLTDIQGRNRYFGWYGNIEYRDFESEMLKEHRAHPDWKLLVSEYGAEGKYGYHVNNPVKFDHSLTYQLALHRTYWETIKKHDFIMGGALWNMFDFATLEKVGNIPHINQKGTATYDRRPKGLYYYYQSEWTDKPMVYIWEHTLIHRYGQPNAAQPVEIFSNCNEVELFVNGISQGKRNKKDSYVWPVRFSEGRHELKVIGHQHGETVSWQMEMYYHHGENPNDYKEGKDVNDATRG